MMFAKKIERVQSLLDGQRLDGWLLYDFRRQNPLACRFLEIGMTKLLTRRFFYFIPKHGSPVKIVSSVENPLKHLPGKEEIFRSWQELHQILKRHVKGKVAMEYSPLGATPEISKVDGGTVDLIRSFGAKVVSSGDLLQEFTCTYDEEKWKSHQKAAQFLDDLAGKTWKFIQEAVSFGKIIDEFKVQEFMLTEIEKHGFTTDHPPICAVNQNSADPHYEPPMGGSSPIKRGDTVLIDLWCKENRPGAVYGDITRVAFVGKDFPEEYAKVFDVVKKAQLSAIQLVKDSYAKGKPIYGFEVDKVCRKTIEKAGYGAYFIHRTGHNIDESDHGPGAHIDDLETHDERRLLPRTCFSIEPGIYLPGQFGVRLECDMYLHPDGDAIVTGGIQDQIVALA